MPPLDSRDFPPPSTFAQNPDYVPAYVAAPATWTYSIDPVTGASRATYPGEFVTDVSASTVIATGSTTPRALQDRFADEINILDWGASNAGIDCTASMQAALATGKNVYMPAGVYRWNNQITVGISPTSLQSQRLRGDGLSTVIIIEPNFNPSATSVILLQGVEAGGPIVQDLYLSFAQPTAVNSRANFAPLGTAGVTAGTLGAQYPPAILFGTGGNNRFKIQRVRISNCWNGIIQAAGTNTGGFWIEDIEMSAYNVGFQVGSNLDMSHLKGWHHWYFNQTPANQAVMQDGLCFCMQLGYTAATQSLNIEDISDFTGRIQIDNNGSMVHIANLTLDGNNAEIDHINSLWTQIVNVYSTCSSTGPSSGNATFWMQAGRLDVANYNGWSGLQGLINQTGGNANFIGGRMFGNVNNVTLAKQSAGVLRIANMEIQATTTAAWTNPLIQCTGGTLIFTNNNITTPSVGDVGAVVISTDGAGQTVTGNYFNGWAFTPPGTTGAYQTGGNFYTKTVTAGSMTLGSPADTASRAISFQTTGQRTINFLDGSIIRWAAGAGTSAGGGGLQGDDFAILRYNASGVQQSNPLVIRAATGLVYSTNSPIISSYSVAPESLPAQYGWRGMGLFGQESISPGFEIVNNSNANSMPYVRFARSRGTAAAPTTLSAGDILGDIMFGGYDGTAWQGRAVLIRSNAAVPWVNGSANDANLTFFVTIGTTLTQMMLLSSQGLGLAKITAAGTAPGAGQATLAFVPGTTGGTAKLVAYAGTSPTPTTIMDNIGAGF